MFYLKAFYLVTFGIKEQNLGLIIGFTFEINQDKRQDIPTIFIFKISQN